MGDLAQWLTAQLEDGESAARGAKGRTGGRWTQDDGPPEDIVLYDMSGKLTMGQARHIARHDPARVLREIDAKRKLVKLHGRATLRAGGGAQYYDTTTVCRSCEANLQFPDESWPCTTLRLLAAPYSDRPGFREEWKP